MKSIQGVLKVQEGGLLTGGPPCGSFIFLNMATSKRTKQRPLGGPLAYVKHANQCIVCIKFRVCCKMMQKVRHMVHQLDSVKNKRYICRI